MSRPDEMIVIDASVAVKLFMQEDYSDRAEKLFSMLGSDVQPVFIAPDLFFAECANVFRTYFKMRALDSVDAKSAMAILLELPLQRLAIYDHVAFALELALDNDISVYDALYLAVAVHLGARFVTADRKLVRKLQGRGYDIIWLGGKAFTQSIDRK